MGKSTISMAILNSYVSHYQRVSFMGVGLWDDFTDFARPVFSKKRHGESSKTGQALDLGGPAQYSGLGNPYCVGIFQWLD